MNRRWIVLGGAGALLATALVGGTLIGSALGRDEDGAERRGGAGGGAAMLGRGAFGGLGSEYCDVFLDAFASELGVDRDRLAEAGRAAANAAVDAAVEAGDLSGERAARIREHIADADADMCARFDRDRSGGPGGDGRRGLGGFALLAQVGDAAADALGVERAELVGRLRDGESLREIAEAEGVDYATVTAAVTDAARARLEDAVARGRITQERADRTLDQLTEFLDEGGSLGGWGDDADDDEEEDEPEG